MKDLYISNEIPRLQGPEGLNSLYAPLFVAVCNVETAFAAFKQAKSGRTGGKLHTAPSNENERVVFYQRERVYEVCYIRLEQAVKAMFPLLQPVWDEAQSMRALIDAVKEYGRYGDRLIETANVAAAEEVYNFGCTLYFEFKEIMPLHNFGIDTSYTTPPADPRQYVVLYSMHGGNERCAEDKLRAPGPYMTLREAHTAVCRWSSYSNGAGDGVIYDVVNKKHINATWNESFKRDLDL